MDDLAQRAERLEAILYERDELREQKALEGACAPCRAGEHEECSLARFLEVCDSDAVGPNGLGRAPTCTCPDCALAITEAAKDPIPVDVWNEVVVGLAERFGEHPGEKGVR